MSPSTPAHRTSKFPWRGVVTGLLIALAFAAARFFHLQDHFKQALAWVGTLGPWGPLLFIALYIVATILFIPGSVLTLGAGALFGVVAGSIYVSLGSTLGATAAFLLGRHVARDAITRKLAGNTRFTAIDKAVASDGWKIVGLTRLSPAFPFTLLNYAFGLTQVSLRDYVVASWIGMMPGTVLYVYLGSLATAATAERTRSPAEWTFYGVGLVATLAVTFQITRIAKRSLAKRIDS